MQIIGYKCFNEDMTNSYGVLFEIGKCYKVDGAVKFGLQGNGFHMCEHLEDTLRYFDAMKSTVTICVVAGSGDIVKHYDEYYGYDVVVVEELTIIKTLSREEIINLIIKSNKIRVKRFIMGYKLNNDELYQFKKTFENEPDVLSTIEYYQENNKDAFQKQKTY